MLVVDFLRISLKVCLLQAQKLLHQHTLAFFQALNINYEIQKVFDNLWQSLLHIQFCYIINSYIFTKLSKFDIKCIFQMMKWQKYFSRINSLAFQKNLPHKLFLQSFLMNSVQSTLTYLCKMFKSCFNMMNNQNKQHNQRLRRNNQIFALLMIISQIGFSIIYGITYSVDSSVINISSIINVIALAILVLGGFGLVFSYLKRLIWSGLGFTFFITALSIELYPLINNFWVRTRIHATPTSPNWSHYTYNLLLTNNSQQSDKLYGNTITNAFKCALAIAAAFSSILGRAGALQCYIVTAIGTIGFELNRNVILNISKDSFGTYFIFTFGGFMGLALGIILKTCREKLDNGSSTSKNSFNQSSFFSSSLSVLGSLIILALFPFLSYEVDNSNIFNTFYLYTGPTCLLLGMAASLIGSFCISVFANGDVIIRDMVHAPIAGGIVVGSASFYITNPVYAILAGFTAGASQSLIQNYIQKTHLKQKSVVSTISWSLFGLQGIIGGIFASVYQAIIQTNSNGFVFHPSTVRLNPGYQLLAAAISTGIGLGFGMIAGLIILLVSSQKGSQHFVDRTYWINDDGISFSKKKNQRLQKSIKPISPVPNIKTHQQKQERETHNEDTIKDKNVRIQYSEVVPFDLSTPKFQMSFSEASKAEISHAYL